MYIYLAAPPSFILSGQFSNFLEISLHLQLYYNILSQKLGTAASAVLLKVTEGHSFTFLWHFFIWCTKHWNHVHLLIPPLDSDWSVFKTLGKKFRDKASVSFLDMIGHLRNTTDQSSCSQAITFIASVKGCSMVRKEKVAYVQDWTWCLLHMKHSTNELLVLLLN